MDPFEFAAEVDRLDDDAAYERLRQLIADPVEAMRVAVALLDAREHQDIAADILNQVVQDAPDLAEDAVQRLGHLLDEDDPLTLTNAVIALGHAAGHQRVGADDLLPRVLALAGHPHEDVRHGVAWALPSWSSEDLVPHTGVVEALLTLMTDDDVDVRDWATFGIARQIEVDSDEIRAALRARLDDEDHETRTEAAAGLAMRGEAEGRAAVEREIEAGTRSFALWDVAWTLGIDYPEDEDPDDPGS